MSVSKNKRHVKKVYKSIKIEYSPKMLTFNPRKATSELKKIKQWT